MAVTTLDTAAASLIINLVTFSVQTTVPTEYLYAFSDKDITLGPDTFSALPQGEITFSEFTGGPKSEPVKITMIKAEPFLTVLIGEPHQKIDVTIEEIDPRDSATRRVLYVGEVRKVIGGVNQRPDLVRVEITGLKFQYDRPLGIEITDTCSWRFGDGNCDFDVEAETTTADILTIDKTIITLDTIFVLPRLRRGRLRLDGLDIVIKQHLNGTQVQLIEKPPAAWAGATVDVVVGCDKSVSMCGGTWDNLENFGGFGLKMLEYHPVVEQH